jgi:UDP-2-acetamido-3-amino-2,3-dideoxy-glucuronate N-acetyltransferase
MNSQNHFHPYAIVETGASIGESTTVGACAHIFPKAQASASQHIETPPTFTFEGAACQVAGVRLYQFPLIKDLRGALTFGEFQKQIPFDVKRYFIVFDVPSKKLRGEHAHHASHEFLICIHGSCVVITDDGKAKQEVILDSPHLGVYVPPLTWRVHYNYSPDAVLLVFSSEHYDDKDYIRSYQEFLKLVSV